MALKKKIFSLGLKKPSIATLLSSFEKAVCPRSVLIFAVFSFSEDFSFREAVFSFSL